MHHAECAHLQLAQALCGNMLKSVSVPLAALRGPVRPGP